MWKRCSKRGVRLVALFFIVAQFAACTSAEDATTTLDTNLLKNPSFETVRGGAPGDWQINVYRGLGNQKAALYGIADDTAYDGEKSFFFSADDSTLRFFSLSQEVKVSGVDRIRVRARLLVKNTALRSGQYPQANVALTFYDQNKTRFNAVRFADVRTPFLKGTSDGWELQDRTFTLPQNTAYIVVHCVLGMTGEVWFDDLSLDVPTGLPWQRSVGEIFAHHWLGDGSYPDGAIDVQNKLYGFYTQALGIPKEDQSPISYFLYPDTASLRSALGVNGPVHVNYSLRQIHSLKPVEEHEIIHLITDPYGQLPRTLGEGLAFYLMDRVAGDPIQPRAQTMLRAGKIPPIINVIAPLAYTKIDPDVITVSAASFVGYVVEFGGTDRFLDLHRQTALQSDPAAFPAVFEQVYGQSLVEADRRWRKVLSTADFSKFEQPSPQKP